MKDYHVIGLGRDVICPICKKEFILPPETVYRLSIKGKVYHYCSYTCFRVDQKKLERSKKK